MNGINEMTNYIKSFSLNDCPRGNQGYDRILLQLFGFLGHGKSSFINTCKYVLEDGEYHNYTNAKMSQGGDTKARITYPMTDTMTLVDNRGCAVMNDYETGEIYAQLANLLPLDTGVEWSKGFGLTERIIMAEQSINSSDIIFPIFVYSVKTGLQSSAVPEIKQLLEFARDITGIWPVVVLTHKTQGDVTDMERTFKNMGVEWIFSLENFTPEDTIKTRGRHEDVLRFFCEVIKDVGFRLERMADPVEQRKQRKLKVFKFMSDRDERKRQEEMRMRELEMQRETERRLEREREERRGNPLLHYLWAYNTKK